MVSPDKVRPITFGTTSASFLCLLLKLLSASRPSVRPGLRGLGETRDDLLHT